MKYLIILGSYLKRTHHINLSLEKGRVVLLFLILSLSNACSNDDNLNEDTGITIPNITVLGRTNDAIIQANIVTGNSISLINLTQQLGVDPASSVMPISNNSNLIGFYRFPQGPYGNYTVWEKDIETEFSSEYNTPCGLVLDEPYYFPKAFEDIITVFSTAEGTNNTTLLSLNIFDKNSGSCSQVNLGETSPVQRPLRIMKGNFILTYHVNTQQESIITKINASTGAVEDELIHNSQVSAVLQGDIIHLYIQATDLQHLRYDFNSFGFNGASIASDNLFLETGLFETSFDANEMLINLPYLQPSQFSQGPALLNLDSGEFRRIVDIPQIKANLVGFINTTEQVELSDFYEVALDKDLIIGAYFEGNNVTDGNYGLYFANLDGSILSNLVLGFEPEEIILR